MSQASFSQFARNAIRGKSRFHSTPGEHCDAIELGILPADYQGNAAENGLLLCPTCRAYFTQNFLALSLPIPVLEYVRDYLRHAPKASRKPLHEVFDLLVEASQGTRVELPNAKAIFPYLGLFTLVTLNPTVIRDSIVMPFLPPLSVFRGKKIVKAASGTFPTSKNVARIFNPLSLVNNPPFNFGAIPISPDHQAFTEKRYWRIPVPPVHIFAALIERLQYDSSRCQDIKLAKTIHHILGLQSLDEHPPDKNDGNGGPSGGSGPNDDNEGGRPREGGRASKRKATGGKISASPRKGIKKARKTSGGSRSGACNESGEFPPRARYHNQQSDRCGMASSTYLPDDDDDDAPAYLISTGGVDDSDSENGRSVSAVIPHDEDNPAEW